MDQIRRLFKFLKLIPAATCAIVPAMIQVAGPVEAERNFCIWIAALAPNTSNTCLHNIPGGALYFLLVVTIIGSLGWFFWPKLTDIFAGWELHWPIQKKMVARRPSLSLEEQQFRLGMRKFVLSTLKDNNDKLLGIIYSTMNRYAGKSGDSSLPIRSILTGALQNDGIQADFASLTSKADIDIETIDKAALESAIAKYLIGYAKAQEYLKHCVQISKVEPETNLLQQWEDSDLRCLERLHELQVSPVANELKNISDSLFAPTGRWKWK